ncbi:MAG TPA: pyrimidine reductase family protein [Pseudonocardia sp.]|uniref:pyrimidine reductase family protein n=1 Tax=Pseudonocardia sp. TaxID=60912 RepID=UPI002B666652|nr:pyrimidine reductase family protein [Pseudonocardia sp.]HTF50774.1 pyrimidine reductase family protein [Pseudonocardia sp.]
MRRLLPWPPADDLTEDDLLAAYGVPPGQDHVRVNFVTSLDGASTIDGRSASLGSPGDQRIFRVLRALADVVLVGAGTVRAEGYAGDLVDDHQRDIRTSLGLAPIPRKAIVSHALNLDTRAPVFSGPRPIVITHHAVDQKKKAELAEVADLMVCGDTSVDLELAIQLLARDGLHKVLCEGGPSLFGALIEKSVADELCLTLTPVLAGDRAHRLVQTREQILAAVQLEHILEEDSALFLRYRIGAAPS